MSERSVSEFTVESAALAWLESLGWSVAHGPDLAPDTPGADLVAWIIPKDVLSLVFSTLGVV